MLHITYIPLRVVAQQFVQGLQQQARPHHGPRSLRFHFMNLQHISSFLGIVLGPGHAHSQFQHPPDGNSTQR